jgi:hypothetical protein
MARDIQDLINNGRALELSKRGRAIVELPARRGRELIRQIPKPVQVQLGKVSKRSLRLTLEVFAGLFVIGSIAVALAYGRLNQGPISLSSLVPVMEEAINGELADLQVQIDDAIIERDTEGPGVNFRLRNIRLIDNQGAIVAQAPLAAIGLSGRALLSGKIAPGSVDFIGPRLLLFYSGEEGLSLSFSRQAEAGVPVQRTDGGSPSGNAGNAGNGAGPAPSLPIIGSPKYISITRTITAAFDEARQHRTASSYLTRFGVRDAVVIFDQLGRQSLWQVPDFSIDLEHKKRESVIFGQGAISSANGPWKFNFRSEQSTKQNRLTFTALIKDLVPTGLAVNFPDIPALQVIDLPLSAETSVHLSTSGDLVGAEAKLEIAKGKINVPWDQKRPVLLDKGNIHLRYEANDDRVEILPSRLEWGKSHATISGFFRNVDGQEKKQVWEFELKATDAVLQADEFGLAASKVQQWEAEGTIDKAAGHIVLRKFVMRLPEGLIEFAGTVIDAPGSPEVRIAGNISAMPLSSLKQMWPKFLAGGAREWVGERLGQGQVTGGSFEIDLKAGALEKLEHGGEIPDSGVIVDLNATGLEIFYIPGMPPIQTGDASFRLRGQRMELEVPDGWIVLPTGKKVSFDAGRFWVNDLRPDPQTGFVEFIARGKAEAILELLDHEPLGYAREAGIKPTDLSGKIEGRFKLAMPLKVGMEFNEIRLHGKAVLDDARTNQPIGGASVEGGSVNFDVTEDALEAKGKIVVNGVDAEVSWQRIFDAPADKQPELRLSAVLDQEARAKLGLKLDHMLRGNVPTTVALNQIPAEGQPKKVRVQADLGSAELILSSIGWRKPPGRAAMLGFDIGTGAVGNTQLQNFRIIGDDIAIDGWISLGKDNKPNAFFFPDFSLNVITHLEVKGKLRPDRVWEVSALGPTYDGRQFFRSLFSAGQLAEVQPTGPDDDAGVDLTARVGTVVGFFDTTAKDVTVDLSIRNGHLISLATRGRLNGNADIAAQLVDGGQSERLLIAESDDAGSAFRLIGFYPRMKGGQASLKVTLDAKGLASKTGTLWARDFNVLGDKVVSEVISNAGDDPSAAFGRPGTGERVARRQRIAFDQLEVPFSVGQGRFVLHDSYINGPQLGATLRGSVDFTNKVVDLGGTFIPLYGLNSALGSIPLIGNILVGRRGEGVVGITYTVKGPAGNPQVLVNPLSIVTPGIFRQIFDFTARTPDALPQPNAGAEHQPSVSPLEPNRFGERN